MIEIERKFLVKSNAYKQSANKSTHIVQGFLNTDPNRTVRIRIKGEQAFCIVVRAPANRQRRTRSVA